MPKPDDVSRRAIFLVDGRDRRDRPRRAVARTEARRVCESQSRVSRFRCFGPGGKIDLDRKSLIPNFFHMGSWRKRLPFTGARDMPASAPSAGHILGPWQALACAGFERPASSIKTEASQPSRACHPSPATGRPAGTGGRPPRRPLRDAMGRATREWHHRRCSATDGGAPCRSRTTSADASPLWMRIAR